MSYIYAVSDIHGRYDLLQEIVCTHVHFDQGDQLILLGDYVDGDQYGDAYLTLQYIYNLQLTYPQQIIVLRGNHEEWLSAYLNDRPTDLNISIDIPFHTLESFMGEEQFDYIYQKASLLYHDRYSLLQEMYKQCQKYIVQKHKGLVQWLEQLPYYYETKHQIFVHAGLGIIPEQPQIWRKVSDVNHYLMQSTPSKGKFYKKVIAGHIGTHQLMQQDDFHYICCFGDFIYIDSTVVQSHFLNVLQIDVQKEGYNGLKKQGQTWMEYKI